MRRIFQFLIFISMILSLSILLNIYIFFHMTYMFKFPHNIWFWLLLCISSLSFIFAMFLRFLFENFITKLIIIASSIWLGVLFILIFILLGYDIARFFVPIRPSIAGITIVILMCILVTAGIVNARLIRIREVKIQNKKINRDLRIVHLSDLHLGPTHGIGTFRRIIERVKTLKPDVVLITGDLVDSPRELSKEMLAKLDELESPVFFTTGNHEYYAGLEEVLGILKNTKIRTLRNERVNFIDIQIVGIDNGSGKRYFIETLKNIKIDPKKFSILMYHQPVALKEVNEHGVDLMLAGHTHGGQLFMFIFFAWLIWRYPNGLYRYKNTYLYTSPGTGTWGPPIRLGTNCEITLLKLGKQ